jgi:hypothetical protein
MKKKALRTTRKHWGLKTKAQRREVEQWLAIRKKAGLKIDPATAEVCWFYAQTLDPYGVYPDIPEECSQVGREYFARAPGSKIWVLIDDLPAETRRALLKRKARGSLEQISRP